MSTTRSRKTTRSLSKGVLSLEDVDRLRFGQEWSDLAALLQKGDPFGEDIRERGRRGEGGREGGMVRMRVR